MESRELFGRSHQLIFLSLLKSSFLPIFKHPELQRFLALEGNAGFVGLQSLLVSRKIFESEKRILGIIRLFLRLKELYDFSSLYLSVGIPSKRFNALVYKGLRVKYLTGLSILFLDNTLVLVIGKSFEASLEHLLLASLIQW